MNDPELKLIVSELSAIKKLIILLLQQQEVKTKSIAKVLGVSVRRVSQMTSTKKYKKKKEVGNG